MAYTRKRKEFKHGFYTGKLVLTEQLNNPTIVVLTDRNDLEQQLFETFGNCEQLITTKPKQTENRDDLKINFQLLRVV